MENRLKELLDVYHTHMMGRQLTKNPRATQRSCAITSSGFGTWS